MPNQSGAREPITLHKHVVHYAHFTTCLLHCIGPVTTALNEIDIGSIF